MLPEDDKGTPRDVAQYRLETARQNLRAAKLLYDMQMYKDANNRAYYAIFHAVNAVHAMNGKAYRRHKDALGNFNKDYVNTGIFPRDMGKRIARAETVRHASDYDDFYIVKISEVDDILATAEELLQRVSVYLDDVAGNPSE